MKLQESKFEFHRTNSGSKESDPFRIFAFPLARALGDFAVENVVMSSIKSSFKHAELYVYCRMDAFHKDLITNSNGFIDKLFVFKNKESVFPAELFDIYSGRPVQIADKEFYKRGMAHPNLVLTPSMMGMEALIGLPNIAGLHFPEDQIEGQAEQLVQLGLDPDRWFCTLHYRESDYELRAPSKLRDCDPQQFLEIRDYLIDALGAQVVRLGHETMSEFPARDGFVDLARVPDSFTTQGFALTRSRFLFAGPSGVSQLGCAYQVPTAIVNGVNDTGAWRDKDVMLLQRLYDPAGQRISIKEALPTGMLADPVLKAMVENGDLTMSPNTLAELRRVAGIMLENTAGCDGWRRPVPVRFDTFPDELGFPLSNKLNPTDALTTFVEFLD